MSWIILKAQLCCWHHLASRTAQPTFGSLNTATMINAPAQDPARTLAGHLSLLLAQPLHLGQSPIRHEQLALHAHPPARPQQGLNMLDSGHPWVVARPKACLPLVAVVHVMIHKHTKFCQDLCWWAVGSTTIYCLFPTASEPAGLLTCQLQCCLTLAKSINEPAASDRPQPTRYKKVSTANSTQSA